MNERPVPYFSRGGTKVPLEVNVVVVHSSLISVRQYCKQNSVVRTNRQCEDLTQERTRREGVGLGGGEGVVSADDDLDCCYSMDSVEGLASKGT